MSGRWQDRALCNGMNPNDFDGDINGVPKANSLLQKAARVCEMCPVMAECRKWADAEVKWSRDMSLVCAGALYAKGRRLDVWQLEIA